MSVSAINTDTFNDVPEDILKKMKRKKKYIDGSKYKFLEEKYYYESPYYVMTEKVEEISTQNIYTRTLYIIFKKTNKTVANRINQRRDWKPFNLQDNNGVIENSNTTTFGDEIFMEMNPNLFKKKHKEIEDICDNKNNYINILNNPYQYGCINSNRYISQNSVANLSGLGLSLFKNKNKSGYLPPHLKRQRQEEELNLPKSIKIQNIPNYLTKDEIEDWLSQFKIGKFRLSYIRNKRTDEFKGFVFLNFNFHKDAVNSIKVLEGKKLEYNIIEPVIAN